MMRRQPVGRTSLTEKPRTDPPAATCCPDSVPHLSYDFNNVLDIAITTRLLFAIETPTAVPRRCRESALTARSDHDAPGDVFARERQEHIARIVEEHGRARVTELAVRFGVSTVTIRKDLLALEGEGRVVRTHGGAIAADRSRAELAFDVRDRLQPDEKRRIGAAGAALVQDGESIVMDASTTALSVARHLKGRGGWTNLTVLTNGLRLAGELAGHPGIAVLMLGGRVRWEALSVVGQLGDGLFDRINVQKAFVGAAGFTVDSGLADATDEEAQIKRSMVAAAREVIALVDHTKWERVAFATFCRTDAITTVLTDDEAPPAMVRALLDRGVDVRLVGQDSTETPLADLGASPRTIVR